MDTTALKTQLSPLVSYAERSQHPIGKESLVNLHFRLLNDICRPNTAFAVLPIYVRQLGVMSKDTIVEWTGRAFGATFVGTGLTALLEGHLPDRTAEEQQLLPLVVWWK